MQTLVQQFLLAGDVHDVKYQPLTFARKPFARPWIFHPLIVEVMNRFFGFETLDVAFRRKGWIFTLQGSVCPVENVQLRVRFRLRLVACWVKKKLYYWMESQAVGSCGI